MKLSPKKGAILIKTDGSVSQFFPRNGRRFSLEEAQGLVGGYIQVITLPANCILIVNEEGKLQGLPYNQSATAIAYGSYAISSGDCIVGDAVVCPSDMLP